MKNEDFLIFFMWKANSISKYKVTYGIRRHDIST